MLCVLSASAWTNPPHEICGLNDWVSLLSAQADVLYEANFTGDSTTSLNGTSVDTTAITSAIHGTSATATWSDDGLCASNF